MRKLVFLFAIFFSLAGIASLSYAQDEAVDGEALLEAQLPEGVTLETATQEQVQNALASVAAQSSGDNAALTAASNAATNSPRINAASRVSAAQASVAVVTGVQAAVRGNIVTASSNVPTTYTSSVEPDLMSKVVTNVIRNSNLSLNQINTLVNEITTLAQSTATIVEFVFLDQVVTNLRSDVANVVEEQGGNSQTCSVSNDVVTCVPS